MQDNHEQSSSNGANLVPKRQLGKTNLNVSTVGLGCWQLGGDFGPISKQQVNSILEAADTCGISFWDTADVYGGGQSEQLIGDWHQSVSGSRVIATKMGRNGDLYPAGYTPQNMRKSIEDSLQRLQLSSLPLLQLHCIPEDALKDENIWRCLDDLKSEGLIQNIAASVETIEQANTCLNIPAVSSLQIILNIFRQDACESLLSRAKGAGVGVLARLPLASGLLSGKMTNTTQFSESDHRNYNRNGDAFSVGETFSGLPYEKGLKLVDELREFVPQSMTMSQFALRWCLDQDGVSSVLAGASSPQQVISNAQAASLPALSEDTHQALRNFYESKVRPNIRGSI